MKTSKRIGLIFLVFLSVIIFFPSAARAEDDIDITLTEEDKDSDENPKDPNKEGHRSLDGFVFCHIDSQNGVTLYGISEKILTYEIWDENAIFCILSFMEESDFIDYIFMTRGKIVIRLETENHYLWGSLSF